MTINLCVYVFRNFPVNIWAILCFFVHLCCSLLSGTERAKNSFVLSHFPFSVSLPIIFIVLPARLRPQSAPHPIASTKSHLHWLLRLGISNSIGKRRERRLMKLFSFSADKCFISFQCALVKASGRKNCEFYLLIQRLSHICHDSFWPIINCRYLFFAFWKLQFRYQFAGKACWWQIYGNFSSIHHLLGEDELEIDKKKILSRQLFWLSSKIKK